MDVIGMGRQAVYLWPRGVVVVITSLNGPLLEYASILDSA